MKKLLIVTTVPLSLATLIKGQPRYLSTYFDIELATSPSPQITDIESHEGVKVHPIPMSRKITPLQDVTSIVNMIRLIRQSRPDIVYSFTPKAGLVAMMAAFIARVPVRVHNIVGMPLMEAQGLKKMILAFSERLTYRFSTHLFANSFGLREYIHRHLTSRPITVVGHGSINGVDTEAFNPDRFIDNRNALREEHGFDATDFVLLYVGRIVRDKGVNELLSAFERLHTDNPRLKLLLVGDYEASLNPVTPHSLELIENHPAIQHLGFKHDVRPYLAAADLFVLPSYREGLPNSLIEAGSFGLPLLATDINGCNEIILPRENGLLVPPKNVDALADAVALMMNDHTLYQNLKSHARESIVSRFDQEYFWEAMRNALQMAAKGKTRV